MKGPALTQACDIFGDTHINITSEGRPWVLQSVSRNTSGVERAATHPLCNCHNSTPWSIRSFCHGFIQYSQIPLSMPGPPNIDHLLQPLEDWIPCKLIPALAGRDSPNNLIRDLLALPMRLGGIGQVNPTTLASTEYAASCHVSGSLECHHCAGSAIFFSMLGDPNESQEGSPRSEPGWKKIILYIPKTKCTMFLQQSHLVCTAKGYLQLTHCSFLGGVQSNFAQRGFLL